VPKTRSAPASRNALPSVLSALSGCQRQFGPQWMKTTTRSGPAARAADTCCWSKAGSKLRTQRTQAQTETVSSSQSSDVVTDMRRVTVLACKLCVMCPSASGACRTRSQLVLAVMAAGVDSVDGRTVHLANCQLPIASVAHTTSMQRLRSTMLANEAQQLLR
jgi:hypothetical protein